MKRAELVYPLIDIEYLDELAAVLGPDRVRRLMETFLRDLAAAPSSIADMMAARDHVAVRDFAHRLRGGALGFGCPCVAQLAGLIEKSDVLCASQFHDLTQVVAETTIVIWDYVNKLFV